jgi:hypothetical protein
MSKSRSESGADISDYKFWRSQHRPLGDGEAEEQPPKVDTFEDAVFNRLGEETGQSLHGLFWPQVPQAWKNVAGVVGGRLLPMLSAYRQYRKATAEIFEKKSVSEKLYEQVDVEIDGKQVTPDWSDMGELFERLCAAKYFWTVRPWQSSSRVMTFDLDGVPEERGAGVLQVDGTTVKAAGVKLETGVQKRGLLTLQRFELLKQFLRDQLSIRFRKEFDVVQRLKKLEQHDVSDIDWAKPLNQVDREILEEIVFLGLCLEWLKSIDSAF